MIVALIFSVFAAVYGAYRQGYSDGESETIDRLKKVPIRKD